MTTSSKYVNGNTTSRQCVTKVQILLAPFNSSNHLMRKERLYILKHMLSALLELYKSVGRQALKVAKTIGTRTMGHQERELRLSRTLNLINNICATHQGSV